jgi:hypothetical protein
MALNEQTEMAFGDQPPRTDPVSGNEVPPGALPSEVRDDIPARLSEGEYVVPADVLQFFGIKFFEDLRTKAKTELAGLEEGGRMGGEPMPMEGQEELPFSLDELQKYSDEDDGMAANKGGMVSGFNEGGSTDSDTPNYPSGATSVFNMPSTIFKTFINEAGLKMYIRFVNGVPMSPIPTGYTEEGVSVEVAAPVQTKSPQEDEGNTDLENSPFVKPFEIMTRAELARFAAEISKTKVYKAITSYGLISFGAKAQEKKWADYVSKVNEIGTKGQQNFVNGLQVNIDAGDRDANIAIAKVNNGGKDVTHLDIMTGDPFYLKRTLTSNIGISDGDSISGLDGGSSTSGDGTPSYIPIDYSDDVLSADFVGDDDTTDPAITESRYDDADDFEGGGEGGESKVEEPTYTETVRNRIERERAEKMAAIEEQLQEDRDGDRDAENRQDQKKAEEKEKSSKGIAERVERARSGVGGFNKGGLASRKSKKKKK